MNPEMVLWSRVLLQAIWDLAGIKLKVQKSEAPRLQRKTRAWFLAKKQSPGSFIWICNILSLDPDAVRERVLARPAAELHSLMTNAPANWNPASIAGLSGEEVDEGSSEIDQEPMAADAEAAAAEAAAEGAAAEELEGENFDDAPVQQRIANGAGIPVFNPAHAPHGSEERSQGIFG
jgi:hypothetical protein